MLELVVLSRIYFVQGFSGPRESIRAGSSAWFLYMYAERPGPQGAGKGDRTMLFSAPLLCSQLMGYVVETARARGARAHDVSVENVRRKEDGCVRTPGSGVAPQRCGSNTLAGASLQEDLNPLLIVGLEFARGEPDPIGKLRLEGLVDERGAVPGPVDGEGHHREGIGAESTHDSVRNSIAVNDVVQPCEAHEPIRSTLGGQVHAHRFGEILFPQHLALVHVLTYLRLHFVGTNIVTYDQVEASAVLLVAQVHLRQLIYNSRRQVL
mmetsp:Transcript_21211/g.61961  ORF Transcript_21211/g.61961 Transcript_21211/m.61961 type:complete len:266 (-) Transcript_21211:885-1682(-)